MVKLFPAIKDRSGAICAVLRPTPQDQQRGFSLDWLWSGAVDWKPPQTIAPAMSRAGTAPFCLVPRDYSSSLHNCSARGAKVSMTGTVRRFLLQNPNQHGNAGVPLKQPRNKRTPRAVTVYQQPLWPIWVSLWETVRYYRHQLYLPLFSLGRIVLVQLSNNNY